MGEECKWKWETVLNKKLAIQFINQRQCGSWNEYSTVWKWKNIFSPTRIWATASRQRDPFSATGWERERQTESKQGIPVVDRYRKSSSAHHSPTLAPIPGQRSRQGCGHSDQGHRARALLVEIAGEAGTATPARCYIGFRRWWDDVVWCMWYGQCSFCAWDSESIEWLSVSRAKKENVCQAVIATSSTSDPYYQQSEW